MKALLLVLLLTGCATAPDEQAAKCEAGGGCLTITKAQLVKTLQDVFIHGYRAGEDNAPPSCKRAI